MINLMQKLASLDTKKTSVLKEDINEWGGDPATLRQPSGLPDSDPDEHNSQMLDSWADSVEDEFNQYHIKGTLSPDQVEDLAQKISDDLDAPHHVVHTLVKGILDQRARDAEAEPDHDMDQEYSSDLDEASIADIPADVLAKGAAEIEAGADCYDVLNKLNKETGRKYMDQFKSLIRGAQNDAHMEYDTQGGDITPFLLDTMKGLAARGESAGAQGDVGGAHGEETISPIHGGQKEEPTMENLNLESLRMLSGIKDKIAECGMGPMGSPNTPASINITAGSGSELTGMLKDIMNLAGVHQVTPDHMPLDKGPSAIVNAPPMAAEPQMKDLIAMVDEPEDGPHADSMNDADDEQEDENMLTKGLGGMAGGSAGEWAGGAIGTALGGPIGGAIGTVAGDIAGTAMGSDLDDDDKKDESSGEKEKNRPWDSSPHEKVRQDGVRKFGDIDNNHQNALVGKNVKQNESIDSIVKSLYQDYQEFVAEGEKQTMSRAAKGYEKYGKEGMKALAKAGKEGKDLDKVRNKYNKYD